MARIREKKEINTIKQFLFEKKAQEEKEAKEKKRMVKLSALVVDEKNLFN
jgi:hypothetical protein